jgi:undecaprenyl-phosphate 4-deoxy-4-formamido-L-arabinose transferase
LQSTAPEAPALSVVLPVCNQELELSALIPRLYTTLDALGTSYEAIFVDDGSQDGSQDALRRLFEERPQTTRVIAFNTSYGEDNAIMAGLENSRGGRIVTLDVNPLNPPEEIGKLLEAMDRGHDYVGGIRTGRQKTWLRRTASRLMKKFRARTANIFLTDRGCMLRAYDRHIVDTIKQCKEVNTFVPALAYTFSNNPTEVEITARPEGRRAQSLYRLVRLNLDLLTGFTIAPLQIFSLIGFLIALVAIAAFLGQLIYRLLYGAPAGSSTAFMTSLDLFLLGMMALGIGLLGEYIGRINQQVQRRPRFVISTVWEKTRQQESKSADVGTIQH